MEESAIKDSQSRGVTTLYKSRALATSGNPEKSSQLFVYLWKAPQIFKSASLQSSVSALKLLLVIPKVI